MNINDIVTVATDAIPTDNLNAVELAHISGIIAMAVRLAVAEVETELAGNEEQAATNRLALIEAINERNELITAYNSTELERYRLRQELDAMTAARDAAVARSEALAGELAALRTNGVSVTGAT